MPYLSITRLEPMFFIAALFPLKICKKLLLLTSFKNNYFIIDKDYIIYTHI